MPGRVVLVSSNGHGMGADVFVQSAQSVGLSCEMLQLPENGGSLSLPDETAEASTRIKILILLATPGAEQPEYERLLQLGRAAKQRDRHVFIIMYSALATDSGLFRVQCFEQGRCNMVTAAVGDIRTMILTIGGIGVEPGPFTCPNCGCPGLSEDDLHVHFPAYHINDRVPEEVTCPICAKLCKRKKGDPFPPHLHNSHGPPSRSDGPSEEDEGLPLYAYALVVCMNEAGKFLLVQEFAKSGFWLPGGRVNPEETLEAAAVRETEEEAGVRVTLKGILRVEYEPSNRALEHQYHRLRVIFFAQPSSPGQLPKSIPNYESAGAVWASLEEIVPPSPELPQLPLRGVEPQYWCPHVYNRRSVYPLSLLTREGAPPAT